MERQALDAQRRGCRTGEMTRAANAQDGILSLRKVRAGALATMMPLRNAPPETVPCRMRAVATKACRLAPSARRTCRAVIYAADDRGGGAGPAPVWLRSSGGRVEPVAVLGFVLEGGGWAGLMNLKAYLPNAAAGNSSPAPSGPDGETAEGKRVSARRGWLRSDRRVLRKGRGGLCTRPVPGGRPPEDKAAAAVPPAVAGRACEARWPQGQPKRRPLKRRRERSPKKPPADAIFRGCRGCQGSGGWRGWRGKR